MTLLVISVTVRTREFWAVLMVLMVLAISTLYGLTSHTSPESGSVFCYEP